MQLGSALCFNATVTTLHSGYTKLIACAQVWLCHCWLLLSKRSLGNSSGTEDDTVEHICLPFNRERWVIDCSWR